MHEKSSTITTRKESEDAKRFGCISKVKISVRSRSSQHHLVVMLGSFFYGLGGGFFCGVGEISVGISDPFLILAIQSFVCI
jgi:hypothetical protein